MATISSVFKMQDNATKTFNNVAMAMDDVISKADELASKNSNLDAGVTEMNPALTQAIAKYQELINKHDSMNEKYDLLRRQEKLLVQDLQKEKGAYQQNEAAILGIEKKLYNVRKQKEAIETQADKIAQEIERQAQAVVQVANNTDDLLPPQEDAENGFSKWQARIVAINQGLQLAKSIASGVGKVLNYVDQLTLTKSRLDLINDGLQTTEELQNKIFAAANRSRGSYDEMAASVSKIGLLAGDAFKSNDEIVAFTELLNKSFKISGADASMQSSAMYQLTQALSSGALQGDELRTIRESAPMLYEAIAKYTGKSKGELKKMGAEGKITAEIIKGAMFSMADEINAQFEETPMTFDGAMNRIQNTVSRYFQPIADKISDFINSDVFIEVLGKVEEAIKDFAGYTMMAINALTAAWKWCGDNMWLIAPILLAMAFIIGTSLLTSLNTLVLSIKATTAALWKKAAAWAAANWQMLAIVGVGAIVVGVLIAMKAPMEAIVGVILLIAAAVAAWQIAQWAANTAMYACPIVWIIVLVIALVAAIYLFMEWLAKATGLANSGLGMIAGGVNVVIQFFKNLGLAVANIGIGIWNVLSACASNIGTAFENVILSIKSWFYSMLSTALEVVEGICEALNKLPFVEFDYSGITDKAREYAQKSEEASEAKGDYKNLVDEFNKGMDTFETFGEGWVDDAFAEGAAWGDKVAKDIGDAIGSFDPQSALGDLMPKDEDQYNFDSLLNGNGNVPVDIESGEVDISDEDLKMLKDIATREYMLNYKHITPNVNIEFGDVRETADVNQVKDAIQRMMEEELAELYVVEEA